MDSSVKLYDIIVPHLKKAESCREHGGCFADSYKTLSGTNYNYSPKYHDQYARGVLANGVIPMGMKGWAELYLYL